MIDLRRLRVTIEINGKAYSYEDLKIKASGSKFTNALQNECQVEITGLNADTRNFLLTQTSLINNKPRIIVEAGRVSTGIFSLYEGDIVQVEISSPPDIVLTINAKTNNANAMKIVSTSEGALTKLSRLAQIVAANNGKVLLFEATDDKWVSNYTYSGPAAKQIRDLEDVGGVNAFIDDNVLVVKDRVKAINNRRLILNMKTGLVGIPKAIDGDGVEITYLINSESVLGGQVTLESKFNKSLNGDYIISKLDFSVSNHDDDFFYTIQGDRL